MNRAIIHGAALCIGVSLLGGCALTRHDQLARKSDRVEGNLKKEQRRVLAMAPAEPERSPRLDHLQSLRYTLSAANIALASVKYAVPEAERGLAYDVLEEAYDTIDWNIPLGPNDAKRSLPARFSGGALRLDDSAPAMH